MSQSSQLIDTLKRELRRQRITYRQVAQALDLSEPSVKRLFAGRFCTLERLEKICELLGLGFNDLVQLMEKDVELTSQLTLEQERELISDNKLLLVAYCLVNGLQFTHIVSEYQISETEGIRLLARLDRMKIIELLPGNRVKLLVAPNFDWIANGPIQRFFEAEIQSEFFDSRFDGAGEIRVFISGLLSRDANAEISKKVRRLAGEFNELVVESKALPPEQKFGTSLLMAMRPWDVRVFRDLRREPDSRIF